jgi:uncharacterized phage protein (TIGR01671 family)
MDRRLKTSSMRTIKFRAWVENGTKLVPSPIVNIDSYGAITLPYPDKIYVNPILEEFTGLLDKNGVEIYEGDIVEDTRDKWHWGDCSSALHGGKGIVTFVDGSFEAVRDLDLNWCTPNHIGSAVEVIGNIHQNPELLK